MLGHSSLSFQYSRWSIGFFHRVFAFVRVEQTLESFTSPLYIQAKYPLFSFYSCCSFVLLPNRDNFIHLRNRGLLLQDLGVNIANGIAFVKESRTLRFDPVRNRCVVQTFHFTGHHTCLLVPDLQVPGILVRIEKRKRIERRTVSREELSSTGALLVGPSHSLSPAGTLQKHLQ
ncbi:hypothetical protein BDL97_02G195100 [Sphagnum fallax]|nr:hypothetical protein BDL97_02G195100 [Sphagnum fallax]